MLELLQAGLPRCPMLRQVIVQPNRDRAVLRQGLSVLGWRLDAEEVVEDRFQTLVWTPGVEPLRHDSVPWVLASSETQPEAVAAVATARAFPTIKHQAGSGCGDATGA